MIPPFRLVDGDKIKMHGAGVFGLDNITLKWDRPA